MVCWWECRLMNTDLPLRHFPTEPAQSQHWHSCKFERQKSLMKIIWTIVFIQKLFEIWLSKNNTLQVIWEDYSYCTYIVYVIMKMVTQPKVAASLINNDCKWALGNWARVSAWELVMLSTPVFACRGPLTTSAQTLKLAPQCIASITAE